MLLNTSLFRASLVAQVVKNLPATWETWVQSLGWEDPLEEGMATHSSILAWRIQWIEEPGRLQSMGPKWVGHNWVTKHNKHNKCSELSTWLSDRESSSQMGNTGSIPGWGRLSEEANGNPLQHSCLRNPMDREARWTTIHGVAKMLDKT